MTDAVVISAADLGSNTVKIMHAMREFNGMVHPLSQATNTIRLGAGIESTGMIERSRIDACIEFLVEQEQVGQALRSIAFVGVATEALRVASNGQDLLDRIATETSWEVRVIDGLEEARLTFVGLRDHLPSDAPSAIVDIGGGSTEIVVVDNNQPVWQRSLPLGSGRLADRFFDDDPPGMEATSQAFAAALDDLRVLDDVPVAVDTAVFAGGNGVFLQELIRQLYGDEPFTIHTTERILQHLSTTPASVTADQLGIMLERAKVFPAGVAVSLAVITRTRASTALAVPSGIQPGVIKEFDATGR
jgi:exopolyphosphatase / guanosine-5'-triphosphate,3'-diphosphate pyrophosphatase